MTGAPPLFSVVIPTHNRASLLIDALASVDQQRFTSHEVIVVDDGSTDETGDVVERHGRPITFVRQAQRGPGPARNAGAQRARGEYLAFLDSDDVWFPWTLDAYARAIAQTSRPAFMVGTPRYFSEPHELLAVDEPPLALECFSDYYASNAEWRWWGASAFVIRRDVFDAAGGFADEWINGEDADLAMRIGAAPGFVQVTAPTTFGYRRHAGTAMANFGRTIDGAWHLASQERLDAYPGGAARAHARREILCRHFRSVMLDALREGRAAHAWQLYRSTFGWHVGLARWRFLLGFPVMAIRSVIRG